MACKWTHFDTHSLEQSRTCPAFSTLALQSAITAVCAACFNISKLSVLWHSHDKLYKPAGLLMKTHSVQILSEETWIFGALFFKFGRKVPIWVVGLLSVCLSVRSSGRGTVAWLQFFTAVLSKLRVPWEVSLLRSVASDVSTTISAFIFRVKRLRITNLWDCLGLKNAGTTILRNVGKYWSNNTASHPRGWNVQSTVVCVHVTEECIGGVEL
jgi:hypothetical protein